MSDPYRNIPHQVDSILFEEGSFSSIVWLLSEGHLDYADYLNWREGGAGYLEDYFKTALPEIIESLKTAHCYAEKLKLDADCFLYRSVDQHALKICRSQTDEAIFTRIYQPAVDRIQMDLFFDSAPVLTVEALIRAIVDRRANDVSDLLSQLKALAPEKYLPFERLSAQQKQLTNYPDTQSKIGFLQNSMTPLAFSILGRFANEFLTPF